MKKAYLSMTCTWSEVFQFIAFVIVFITLISLCAWYTLANAHGSRHVQDYDISKLGPINGVKTCATGVQLWKMADSGKWTPILWADDHPHRGNLNGEWVILDYPDCQWWVDEYDD
jgi:hypothetical protein